MMVKVMIILVHILVTMIMITIINHQQYNHTPMAKQSTVLNAVVNLITMMSTTPININILMMAVHQMMLKVMPVNIVVMIIIMTNEYNYTVPNLIRSI